jgi:2-polyprenyl-6-methoxyphenol hydroxylase-like FAD-dependent oxidoreductase
MEAHHGRASRHAVIVGGSVGGLFAGNLLRSQGWRVDILERVAQSLESRGTGIARHRELEEIMLLAGVKDRGPKGIHVEGRVSYDRAGKVTGRYMYPQELGAWNRVFKPLLSVFPTEHYHAGAECVSFEQNGRSVNVHLRSGRAFEADVLIGADGFRSAVRDIVAPDVRPVYSGYVAWRGMVAEGLLSASFRAETFPRYAFLFPEGSQFIGYPMGGEDGSIEPGKRRYTYLWYSPVSATPPASGMNSRFRRLLSAPRIWPICARMLNVFFRRSSPRSCSRPSSTLSSRSMTLSRGE